VNHPGRVVIGAALIVVGVIALLGRADVVDAGEIVSTWWPLLVIGLGVAQYLADPDAWIGALIVTVIGVLLLGTRLGTFGGSVWSWVWPIGLIGIGLSVFVVRLRPETRQGEQARITASAVLSARQLESTSQAFEGADLTAAFGSLKLNLTSARPVPGARITATVLLGGVDVIVPNGWKVKLSGTPILGSWDNTTRRDSVGPDAPELEVRALVVLGGVEVRHVERWV
jgi:LiaF transmembrane domain